MNIVSFKFEANTVRAINKDGEPWFVAKDVAMTLGYSNTKDAIARHCKRAGILNSRDSRPLGFTSPRGVTIIPESDLYRLIMRSKLPAAERFEEWVTSEVLPSIRKHGAYMTESTLDKALTDPDFLIQLATQLKEERAKRIEAERTKAQISDKKTATAMATASAEKRKRLALENRLGEGQNWKTVKAIPWLREVFFESKGMYSAVGHYLKKLANEMGLSPRKVPSPQYTEGVNAYHISVINEFKKRLDSNPLLLSVYRLLF